MAIPAVGEHIADKLLELRKAGHIAALEELHAQLPAGLRALLGIPGLGPKRGWGETSERNLARAIQRMQEVGGACR